LDGELAAIAALRSTRDVYGYMGRAQRPRHRRAVRAFVGQDGRDATRYLVALNQAGLSMPDRDYYLVDEPRNLKTRAALAVYIEKLLTLAGRKDGAAAAQRIIALEKRIAEKHWTRVENRNPVKTYNKVTLAAAAELAPGFDFTTFLAEWSAGRCDHRVQRSATDLRSCTRRNRA
jgi:predicted metalloendopeptidase